MRNKLLIWDTLIATMLLPHKSCLETWPGSDEPFYRKTVSIGA